MLQKRSRCSRRRDRQGVPEEEVVKVLQKMSSLLQKMSRGCRRRLKGQKNTPADERLDMQMKMADCKTAKELVRASHGSSIGKLSRMLKKILGHRVTMIHANH